MRFYIASRQAINFSKSGQAINVSSIIGVTEPLNQGSWKNRLPPRAGKEVVIKTMRQAILVYSMSVFLLPHNSSDDMQKMMNSFWWGSEGGRRRTHWASWERLYVLKKYGDMGFRKLYCFNLAQLGNQGWRFLTSPKSLSCRIFKLDIF
ncbi:hypothetical protein GOBAR_AA18923 [Gossypium barbadense]|uniref:Reverse transcriptase zinc-binding domain-containing protein n=1 Tax=Gossypium barbadense TaxID=3634 RepID=A0A2P5XEJ0_GOSBA|nr:hypothetical protein GOBAR_AA18923 [Gossypium barbadense]